MKGGLLFFFNASFFSFSIFVLVSGGPRQQKKVQEAHRSKNRKPINGNPWVYFFQFHTLIVYHVFPNATRLFFLLFFSESHSCSSQDLKASLMFFTFNLLAATPSQSVYVQQMYRLLRVPATLDYQPTPPHSRDATFRIRWEFYNSLIRPG